MASMSPLRLFLLPCLPCLCLALVACSSPASRPTTPSPESQKAVAALQAGDFAGAEKNASEALVHDRGDARAAAVHALARYQIAFEKLFREGGAVLESAGDRQGFDHQRMRAALDQTSQALAAIDADLAVAGADRGFALELCLACWKHDWNHSGAVDERDERLFQVEIDAQGEEIPEGDPRRMPRFHFDVGDVYWARAMASFQRALIELVLAYRWNDLDILFFGGEKPQRLVIHLEEAKRVAAGRAAILAGLGHADRARREYLAETDDDAEWVPSPRQRNHPLPLPVDEVLYETWAGVIGDVERLVSGKEAISVTELAQLGDHTWEKPPGGYIDIGRMLSQPRDIVFDIPELERLDSLGDKDSNVEAMLASILGGYYVRSAQPTPLIRRLERMKNELERGEDSFERKLRYLFWFN